LEAWQTKQKREEYRLARLLLTVSTAAGAKRKGGGNLTINDFLPDYVKSKKKLDPEESAKRLEAFFIAMAERSKKKKENVQS